MTAAAAPWSQAWERDLERLRSRWGPALTIDRTGGEFVASAGIGEIVAAGRDADVLDAQLADRSIRQSMGQVRERHGHVTP